MDVFEKGATIPFCRTSSSLALYIHHERNTELNYEIWHTSTLPYIRTRYFFVFLIPCWAVLALLYFLLLYFQHSIFILRFKLWIMARCINKMGFHQRRKYGQWNYRKKVSDTNLEHPYLGYTQRYEFSSAWEIANMQHLCQHLIGVICNTCSNNLNIRVIEKCTFYLSSWTDQHVNRL